MMNLDDSSWKEYRLFGSFQDKELTAILGLSPENSFNLYGKNEDAYYQLINFVKDTVKIDCPTAMRGDALVLNMFSKFPQFLLKWVTIRPVIFLTADPYQFEKPGKEYSVRYATSEQADMSVVSRWFDEFNKEMGTSFLLPEEKVITDKRIIFLVDNQSNEIKGCCMISVPNEKRLWRGRFYIFNEFRKSKIGHLFQLYLAALARDNSQELHTHVQSSNIKARNLFNKLGYKARGVLFNAKMS